MEFNSIGLRMSLQIRESKQRLGVRSNVNFTLKSRAAMASHA